MISCRALGPVLVAIGLAACGGGSPSDAPETPIVDTTTKAPPAGNPALGVHVQGNHLVDSLGRVVRLRGVNRSGGEYACAQGWGFFDGPSDSASIAAIASWHVNVVRVPVNETCWLGINGVVETYGGAAYRQFITQLISRINKAGMAVILDLHWAAPGDSIALRQWPMPNRDHTPEFWRQAATAFKDNRAVVFDLFNEPYPDDSRDTPEAWRCWRDGGTCAGISYQAAGMQELVTAVRSTGATNVIMAGGVQYASGLSQWRAFAPTDPANNLMASWHVYNFSGCSGSSCWYSTAGPVAREVPLVLGELGDDQQGTAFVTSLMDWMDTADGAGYLAWSWDVWGSPLDVIKNYDGTPTTYGQVFKTRFAR